MSEDDVDRAGRVRDAGRRAARTVFWRKDDPATHLAALAGAVADLGIEGWDTYGDGGAVAALEAQVAELLGHPAAVLLPTGVLAQQIVLRVWSERSGSPRIALPDLAHPVLHEEGALEVVHGLRLEALTRGRRVATAADLDAVPGRLGAVMVELPLRDAGCLLPTWEELVALSAAARERGVPLHLDGARIWEAQAALERPLADFGALADSVYVSLYKGLGAMGGALVACPADVAREIRLWRRRLGGTVFHLTPFALGGLVGLRDELPRMPASLAWARELAAALAERGLRCHPEVPHIATFELYADGVAAEVNERVADLVAEHDLALPAFWPGQDPGTVRTELAVGSAALDHEPAVVADLLARAVGATSAVEQPDHEEGQRHHDDG